MNHSPHASRRTFLKTAGTAAAIAGVASYVPRHVLGAEGVPSANERVNLGVIGFGNRCKYVMGGTLPHADVQCIAIADVWNKRRTDGKAIVDKHYGNNDCETMRDFRELLERDDIDAVLIATGDRWHAAASILAAKAGKDVYSEKPCGITIEDCQQLADTITGEQKVFQAGTQRRSVPNFIKAVELAHSGKLGELQTLHASVYRPVLDNSWLPAQAQPPQDEIDWNLWLGPATWRPFNLAYVQGKWRGQWDFDSGARLLDWGAHTVDLCQWANKADDTMPIEFEPREDGISGRYENGVKLEIDFLDDPFGDRSPHYITRLGTCPVRFVGSDGWVETGDSGEIVCSSPSLQKEITEDTTRVRGLDVASHSRNFLDCIRSRKLTAANQNVMRKSHIACHAAATAWIFNRKLTINPRKESFVDDPAANGLSRRPDRVWNV
ncbi:Gfo/Idh/MocA family protein [Bremerella sp. T1]|uniref:Gfo/Idh/MocA family protein n=1 Tax=Bremerella sp. TYQ1 TaxID=3119568 RepID=UPI001CCA094D|nr:Gfo/Idh/MocA family oxidoreductase [Bremerella volcania]UBM37958.1 Gfo/Idh/MocA family oxidoreductase [Bremerella volcania]